jgi:hypothetical protein
VAELTKAARLLLREMWPCDDSDDAHSTPGGTWHMSRNRMESLLAAVESQARALAATPAPLDVRVAARELSDALDAPGPSDPIDGDPLTKEAVNEAWEVHGLRVDLARDALRAALATAKEAGG